MCTNKILQDVDRESDDVGNISRVLRQFFTKIHWIFFFFLRIFGIYDCSSVRIMVRGALIVLEGCDRAGKSTQAKLLVNALNKLNIPTKALRFPDRSTQVGGVINQFLTCKMDLLPEVAHLLFSVNRWEHCKEMRKLIESGTTLIVDRYAASGAAYGAANTGRDLSWCKEPDKGLPAPDLVAYLEVDRDDQKSRNGWSGERFENTNFQDKVAKNFFQLRDETWKIIGPSGMEEMHATILEAVVNILRDVGDRPLKKLYES